MIKIEFDGIIYALQKYGGASVYWKSIVDRVRLDDRFQVTELYPSSILRGLPVCSRADIFHSSHFRRTIFSKSKMLTTVHDLTYELGMLGNSVKSRLNILERKQSYFDADAIVCISENTKKDLLEIYPLLKERCPIHVIHHGYTVPSFISPVLPECLMGRDYLLYVGGRKNYKNFELAIQGFVESGVWRDGAILACTGSEFTKQEIEQFKLLGVSDSVVSIGLVDEPTLFGLYKNAFCLLYTSKYEGFGLPLVEAMSVGCPVIGANVSSIPEIVGNAGFLVNSDSSEQVARAILNLKDDAIREQFIRDGLVQASKFSWDLSAYKHMELYASIASLKYT